MFFQLDLTKALAASSFNAMVLANIEKDALNLAAIRLQKANPGAPMTAPELLREANDLLPRADHPDAMRHFFSTQHLIQDSKFDDVRDLGDFITSRAFQIEEASTRSLEASTSAPQWMSVLSDLAEGYSYVIEAAENLQSQGLVAMRRTNELQAITTRPDDEKEFAKAQLFDKATVFFNARNDCEKMVLKEQYR